MFGAPLSLLPICDVKFSVDFTFGDVSEVGVVRVVFLAGKGYDSNEKEGVV